MQILLLFEQLQKEDIRLWLEGGLLRFSAPPSGLPEHLRDAIQQHKAAIIAFLEQSQTVSAPALTQVDPKQAQPLSFAQQRIAFIQQLLPDSDVFHLQFAFDIQGKLDLVRLEQAVNTLVQQHGMLRTAYQHNSQIQLDAQYITLHIKQLGNKPDPEQLGLLLKQENQTPFQLDKGEVFRHVLYQISPDQHILLITVHHIAADYHSLYLIAQQLLSLYQNNNSLTPLQWHYQDFAAWQHTIDYQNELIYWQEQLQDIAPLQLAAKQATHTINTEAANLHFEISAQQTQALSLLAKQENTTIFTVFLAIFSTLLYRYSQQELFAIGTAISNRQHPELENVIGCFNNLLAIRCEHSAQEQSFLEHLTAIKHTSLAALNHQSTPFEQLVRQLNASGQTHTTPIFQAIINWQEASTNIQHTIDDISISPVNIDSFSSIYDLNLTLQEWQNGIAGKLQFRLAKFDKHFIEQLKNSFLLLVDAVIDNPQQAISTIDILLEPERQQLIRWNQTAADRKELDYVHQYIEQQAQLKPDNIAVVFADQQLSYQQLNHYANSLAAYIQQQTQQPYIAVFCQRSLMLPVVLLAILKSGKAYLPIDADTPTSLISDIFRDAEIDFVICDKPLSEHLPTINSLNIEDFSFEDTANIALLPNQDMEKNGLFSLIYTSGSTGQPKGVVMSHKAMLNRLLWMQEQFNLQTHEAVLHKTSISFDVSIWEIFWPLMQGAKLVLAEPQQQKSALALAELIEQQQIAFVHFVPSMLGLFIEQAKPDLPLRAVITSGEALPHHLCQQFLHKFTAIELYNLYGPTEAAIDVSFHRCQLSDSAVPIGKPIANTQLYVCDQRQQLLPIGAVGEIIIAGRNLAEGYLNRASDSSFIAHPFIPGERAYRSGDLGYFDQNGTLYFIGRQDKQVKIRGFRIELDAITAALTQHPDIDDSYTMTHNFGDNDQRIIAFYKSNDASIDPTTLRIFLQNSLPSYMLPNHFVKVRDWPVNKSGKIAENVLLKSLNKNIIINTIVPPRDDIEQAIHKIWSNLLAVEHFGINDDFFALGGHSLLASQALAEIQQQFAVNLPLVEVFNQATIANIAAVVRKQQEQKTLLIDGSLQEGEQEFHL